ncbi:MAG: vancomycin permeability regulator SanA [Glaciecola sp.]|jgi:vancomycin permeability regulator SanA
MKKAIKYTFWILSMWFVTHVVTIAVLGTQNEYSFGVYTVVFGSKVNEDGTLSKRLAARLDKAVEIYNNERTDTIFVSGGLGKEGFNEGAKMKEYLIKQGVRATKIIVDNEGNTTRLTAINLAKITDKSSSVIVVSQFFHVPRCKLSLQQVGFNEVNTASCDYYEWKDFISISREFFAWYKYVLTY